MSNVLTPSLSILESVTLTRTKFIPKNCELLVKVGDVIEANQVLANMTVPGQLRVVRITEQLELGLLIKEGQQVQRKQPVFTSKFLFGLLTNTFESPTTGFVEKIDHKNRLIYVREPSHNTTINSFISGKVISTDNSQVVIEESGALIQGVIGFGGERFGIIACYGMHKTYSNKIVLCKNTPSISEVRNIIKDNPAGIILPSIQEDLLVELGLDKYSLAMTGNEKINFTIIITEGFGEISMSENTYELIKSHENLQGSINGKTQIRAGAVRPEIVIPNISVNVPEFVSNLDIGSKVRLTRYPYFGKLGTVIELPIEPVILESGVKTRVAKVDIGEEITVPRSNLELLV